MSWDPFSEELACSRCTWLPACMGGCPLKVVFPEAMPEGKVELECTTFKWNWKRTFNPSCYPAIFWVRRLMLWARTKVRTLMTKPSWVTAWMRLGKR